VDRNDIYFIKETNAISENQKDSTAPLLNLELFEKIIIKLEERAALETESRWNIKLNQA